MPAPTLGFYGSDRAFFRRELVRTLTERGESPSAELARFIDELPADEAAERYLRFFLAISTVESREGIRSDLLNLLSATLPAELVLGDADHLAWFVRWLAELSPNALAKDELRSLESVELGEALRAREGQRSASLRGQLIHYRNLRTDGENRDLATDWHAANDRGNIEPNELELEELIEGNGDVDASKLWMLPDSDLADDLADDLAGFGVITTTKPGRGIHPCNGTGQPAGRETKGITRRDPGKAATWGDPLGERGLARQDGRTSGRFSAAERERLSGVLEEIAAEGKLNVAAAAAVLGCSRETVYSLLRAAQKRAA